MRQRPNDDSERAPAPPQRQLFDHRRDDPLRFAALTQRVHPPSSQHSSVMDQSSISSYASSTFTLTSNTGSSHSSAPPDRLPEKGEHGVFIAMLKKVYREISDFEKKIRAHDEDDDEDDDKPGVITIARPGALSEPTEVQDQLKVLVDQHQQ